MDRLDVTFAGPIGNTHVATSLERAAHELGLRAEVIDAGQAFAGSRWVRKLSWLLAGHRPPRLQRFSAQLVQRLARSKPACLVTLGQAPVAGWAIQQIRALGIRCHNYSTDDPWNVNHHAGWFLRSLPDYTKIFTPRRANLADFHRHGCRHVEILPFGYDRCFYASMDGSVPGESGAATDYDLLFIGAADDDRAPVLSELARAGVRLRIYGGFWERYRGLRGSHKGMAGTAAAIAETRAAPVNFCLVRRANRDGHVMRSFEIPAIGGFALMEDTPDHRELFGPEGARVLYFSNTAEALQKIRWALAHPAERRRMAQAAQDHVVKGAHAYSDRLRKLLA